MIRFGEVVDGGVWRTVAGVGAFVDVAFGVG